MSKPALRVEERYRSGLERRVAEQLERARVPFGYETRRVEFVIPERKARYTPDFNCPADIVLETKGYFRSAADRQRLIFVKCSNPTLDVRLVFQDARKPIYKGSSTTYAKWAEDNGFQWADKGTVPPAWIDEMIKGQRKHEHLHRTRSSSDAPSTHRPRAPKGRQGSHAHESPDRVRHREARRAHS